MKVPEFLQKPVIISEEVDCQYKLKRLVLIVSLLMTSIVVTNIIGVKIISFLGFNFTAGVITYGAVFLGTDIIGEIWGKKAAYYSVWLGFLCSLFMLVFVKIAVVSPPAQFWADNQQAYSQTLGGVSRLVLASMAAYIMSQLCDVWAFDFWRRQTQGKFLFLRNNLSTMGSQVLDTIVFIFAAFWPTLPLSVIFTMIVGQILVKWVIAWIDTPIIYLAVWLLGSRLETAESS